MKKNLTLLIAACVVILLIIALNSLCAGCVYAKQVSAPAETELPHNASCHVGVSRDGAARIAALYIS
ncbi:MAG: hypothetical protein ACO1NO_07200 [Burkholderiaceae bacterium]